MRRLVVVTLLLLASCNAGPSDDRIADQADDAAADAVAESPKIKELEDRIDEIERQMQASSRYTQLIDNSLTESRNNHAALLKTFNANVDSANKRDAAQDRDIDALFRAAGSLRAP